MTTADTNDLEYVKPSRTSRADPTKKIKEEHVKNRVPRHQPYKRESIPPAYKLEEELGNDY